MKSTLIGILAIAIASVNSVNAEEIIKLQADKAREQTVEVSVANGQSSPIIYKNGEIIDAVKLADMSKNLFSFNAPIDSGKATTLNITQSEGIEIPGATTANVPIIDVETIDAAGERQHYSFRLYNNRAERTKIFIEAAPAPEPPPEPEPKPVINTVKTKYDEATPEDVALGLEVKIREQIVDPQGSLALAVREYVAKTQNGMSSTDALSNVGLPLSAIQKLGEIGQEEDTKQRLTPLKTNFSDL